MPTSTRPCPLCGAERSAPLPFRYAFKERHLLGVRCQECGLTYVDPQPSAEEIEAMYAEEYFTENSATVGAHGAAAYMEMAEAGSAGRARAAAELDRTLTCRTGGRGRYLEIGCGPGFFLAQMAGLGWRAEGLELSDYAARFARERLDLAVTCGAIEHAEFEPESFDVVFMGDVLEHLPDPKTSLGAVRRWLKPQGLLVVAVPSTMNLLSAQVGLALYRGSGRVKTLRLPPYHLFEYTPSTLARMLRTTGFELCELRQSAAPIARMGLRGSPLENFGKVALQIGALATSRLFNRGGDRLRAIARRENSA